SADHAPTREGDLEEPSLSSDEVLVQTGVGLRPLKEGARLAGYVRAVDNPGKKAEIDLVGRTAQISFSSITWDPPRGVGKWTEPRNKISDVLKPGEVVRVRILKVTPPSVPLEATLDQVPEVQGALMAMDPKTRQVVAMTGGYDFELSQFN